MIYEAKFSIRLRSLSKEVADFEDRMNEHLAEYGVGERLYTEAQMFTCDITVPAELTEEQQYKIINVLTAQVIEHMPKYDIRFKSFGPKSNQLVEQSAE